MKVPINLASQPFRRVRAILLASAAVSVLLAVTLGALVSLIFAERAQMADVRRDVNRLNHGLQKAAADQAKLAAVLNRPENAEVLETSVFVNTLLYRKGISWTRIFSDLEKTLPYNVKILEIRPTLDAQNHVMLDMTLASASWLGALKGLEELENSPRFGQVFMSQNIPPTQTDPLFKCRVTVSYAQQL